jgi:N-acetylmuramic acid 6-phosphate etherase
VAARVIVISGTGSCCYGESARSERAKVGGWGHLLGDRGSGYDIALRALRAVVHEYDRRGAWPALGARMLRALLLNEPNHLVDWLQSASKADVAILAVEVFAAWQQGDLLAARLVSEAAQTLAADAAACARRLASPGALGEFIFAGSVLLKQPRFAALVKRWLRGLWPDCLVTTLEREGAWGAVALAQQEWVGRGSPARLSASQPPGASSPAMPIPDSAGLSPTEQRNPRSLKLDQLSLAAAIALMASEDSRLPGAILKERRNLERAIRLVVKSLRRGGRLLYVGAGTSGRLGVLDASECPPTFSAKPEQVQGIMAGGQRALWSSVEGAEDDAEAGARSVEFRKVGQQDVVLGIAASGRTPFVWGALTRARQLKATTILLCFNPKLKIARQARPDVVIAPMVGPEVLTGSTRLKAGTATKLILNMLSTLVMVRLGKVISNLMVDVQAANAKLRERAVRIVGELTGADRTAAQQALEQSDWVVKSALKKLRGKRHAASRSLRSKMTSSMK